MTTDEYLDQSDPATRISTRPPPWVVMIMVLSTFTQLASASVTYSYIGNGFNNGIQGSVSGYFTVNSALSTGLSMNTITPTTLAFTVDSSTATEAFPTSITTFKISTDSLGQITGWFIDLYTETSTEITQIQTSKGLPWTQDSFAYLSKQIAFSEGGYNSDNPGQWTQYDSSTVPEPQSFVLCTLGLAGLAYVARKRMGQGKPLPNQDLH